MKSLTAKQSQQCNEGVSDQVGLLAPLLVRNAEFPQSLGNDIDQIAGGHSPDIFFSIGSVSSRVDADSRGAILYLTLSTNLPLLTCSDILSITGTTASARQLVIQSGITYVPWLTRSSMTLGCISIVMG